MHRSTDPASAAPVRRARRHRRLGAVGVACVLSLGALGTVAACGGEEAEFELDNPSGEQAADYRYVIPPGAKDAENRGEPLEIIPADLQVKVGEVIEIVNEDSASHFAGPFFIRAGETLRQEFASAGQYTGECSVHPSGQITITVT